MKKLIVLLVAFSLAGCHNYKNDVARLTTVQDSLKQQTLEKDSAILGYLTDLNEIQENLDSIKKIEKLVSVDRVSGTEIQASKKKQIVEGLAMIKELLEKNKAQIASLKQRLSASNMKVGDLEKTVVEFEKMVTALTSQIEVKDAEIAELNQKMQKLVKNIDVLNQQYVEAVEDSRKKSQTIESQSDALNTAYFAFGSVKELTDNNVIEKQGGVLGLGSTVKIRENFNRDYFTKIKISNFDFLPLMVKKAKVVSVHPEGSYHISGIKTADTLFIDNRQEFWKASKYLLIVGN